MKFWKLHGIGNDFIAIDDRENKILDYSKLAETVCNRRFSVGADGFLAVNNSNSSDVKMTYYNADGSLASMCGNGLRCFVRFVYENKIVDKTKFSVETLDGIKNIEINLKDNKFDTVRVDMGLGSFDSKDVPASTQNVEFMNEEINILDKTFKVSAMLMGVPHAVIFVDELINEEVIKYGSIIEKHELFPNNINVNFVKIIDKENIEVKTFERGCGYTFACGTGMTASAIISNRFGFVDKNVNVKSEGGSIKIEVCETNYMIGLATKICEGIVEL